MNKELLAKKEAVMSAACELCRWPADFGEDEEVLYEEHCNHCPVALAVDALCEALQPEPIQLAPLTEADLRPITIGRRLTGLSFKELADEIFNNLAQFPSRDALLAYLREEAKE